MSSYFTVCEASNHIDEKENWKAEQRPKLPMPISWKYTMLVKSLTGPHERFTGTLKLWSNRMEMHLQTITLQKEVLQLAITVLAHNSHLVWLLMTFLSQQIDILM